jgi:hypothetical protein
MAPGLQYDWDPYDWQMFVLQLVRERHGASCVQRVPDRDRGDLGIEAYTTDGCLYQSYAPNFPTTLAQRRDALRAKLSSDIGKLIKNALPLGKILKGVMVQRWVLVVPLFDSKEVLATAEAQRCRVLEAQIGFVAPEFRVLVHDQEDFSGEIEMARKRGVRRVRLTVADSTDGQLIAWWDEHDELAAILLRKLRKAYPLVFEDQLRERALQHIKFYIRFGNLSEQIRETAPDAWDSLKATIATAEQHLVAVGHEGDTARDGLLSELRRVRDNVSKELPGYHPSHLEEISFGVLADWLMRCPLDFTEAV